jgi:hypothetical protein
MNSNKFTLLYNFVLLYHVEQISSTQKNTYPFGVGIFITAYVCYSTLEPVSSPFARRAGARDSSAASRMAKKGSLVLYLIFVY